MRDSLYGFLELPVGVRFTMVPGIILAVYCIFGRVLSILLSIALLLLSKLVYLIYLLIECPISSLHKSYGGKFSDFDQIVSSFFCNMYSRLVKYSGVLYKPKSIHRGVALLVFVICAVYLFLPGLVGLRSGIFTFWENAYLKNEMKLVAFLESTSLFDEPIVTTQMEQTETEMLTLSDSHDSINDDYIFPFSSTRALTEEDLEGLTKEQLRLARNEIYARHGRQYKDEVLKTYFESKEWYQNTPKLPYGTEPELSKLEIENAVFIRDHE